jgi:hypothetical protein
VPRSQLLTRLLVVSPLKGTVVLPVFARLQALLIQPFDVPRAWPADKGRRLRARSTAVRIWDDETDDHRLSRLPWGVSQPERISSTPKRWKVVTSGRRRVV